MIDKQTKITKSARGETCTARLVGCKPGPENETVVLCHAPSFGRGGMRNEDHWAAYCCASCHDLLDGRKRWSDERIMYRNEWCESAQDGFEKKEAWFHAIHETQNKLITKGLIEIK